MDLEIASTRVVAALAEGAELRMKIGRENGPTIVKAATLIVSCLQAGNKLLVAQRMLSTWRLSLSVDLPLNAQDCQRSL